MQRARIDRGQPLEQSRDATSQIKRLAVEQRQRAPHAAVGDRRSGLDVGGLGVFSDRRCGSRRATSAARAAEAPAVGNGSGWSAERGPLNG